MNVDMNIVAKKQKAAVQAVNWMKNLKLFSPTMPPTLSYYDLLAPRLIVDTSSFKTVEEAYHR